MTYIRKQLEQQTSCMDYLTEQMSKLTQHSQPTITSSLLGTTTTTATMSPATTAPIQTSINNTNLEPDAKKHLSSELSCGVGIND